MAKTKRQRKRNQSHRAGDALLVIDVINDLEFPGGDNVLPWAMKMAKTLSSFQAKARRAGMPVIYVNDNFQMWRSNFNDVIRHCERRGARGATTTRRMRPKATDYFILKPRHSAFFATSLLPLLQDLNVKRLILSGIATNLCVLFSAHDAQMLRFPMVVLSDCCAAESDFDHDVALGQLKRFCDAEVCLSTEFRIKKR